ncbi:MAG: hypothetical protein R2939_19155 [Kofleriaceae bacterium]
MAVAVAASGASSSTVSRSIVRASGRPPSLPPQASSNTPVIPSRRCPRMA